MIKLLGNSFKEPQRVFNGWNFLWILLAHLSRIESIELRMQLREEAEDWRRTDYPSRRPPTATRGWGDSQRSWTWWGWPCCLQCGHWAIHQGSVLRRSRSRRHLTCCPALLCPTANRWPAIHFISSLVTSMASISYRFVATARWRHYS